MRKNNIQQASKKEKTSVIATRQEVLMSAYSGPIPPPEILEKYENLAPGTAEKLINQTLRQSEHRMNIENKVIDSKISDSKLGIILGFILGLVALIGSFYLISIGKDIVGVGVLIISIGSGVANFIYATKSNREERKEKRKESKVDEQN